MKEFEQRLQEEYQALEVGCVLYYPTNAKTDPVVEALSELRRGKPPQVNFLLHANSCTNQVACRLNGPHYIAAHKDPVRIVAGGHGKK